MSNPITTPTPAIIEKSTNDSMRLITTALVSTCLTLVALLPIAYMAYRHMPPPVATIDLQKIVEEEQQRFSSQLNNQLSTEKNTAEFAKRLSTAVDQLGQECHCILINKAALFAGAATDYTDLIRERIKQ